MVNVEAPAVVRRLRFKIDVFDRIVSGYGLVTDSSKAKFLGIAQSQFTRVKNGVTQPSQIFIMQVMTALPRVPFDQLFEIVEVER